jgi:outer membrane biosynthesis protein TonB
MLLAELKADASFIAANHKQVLPGVSAAIASIAVNTALVLGAVLNMASPRYLPGLEQFKGGGLVAVSVVGAAAAPKLPSVQSAPTDQESLTSPTQAVSAPPNELTELAKTSAILDSVGTSAPSAAPKSSASAAALASAEVDEYATPSMFLMRQLRIIAGEQLVELRVSVLLSNSGEVESLEIVSSRGDIKVVASWISVLRSARFYPPTKQSQGVAAKLVFEFSTY